MRSGCRRSSVCAALAAAVLVLGATPRAAWSWGCAGHVIVARIAEWHLGAHARERVADILAKNPIDPALPRYCPRIAGDRFADGATWADDVREQRPETAEWHYLDIPRGAATGDVARYCPPGGCVTRAIVAQLAKLRAHVAGAKKAEALRYVVHFVGDVHQPLHCTTNGDRGGNCVPVAYFGSAPKLTDPAQGKYTPNLHQVWDSRVIEAELAARHRTPGELASAIDCRFATQIAAWMAAAPDPEAWARDAQQKAEDVVYGKLPAAVPVATTADPHTCKDGDVTQRMLGLHLALEQPYQDAAFAVIEEQLAKAGARLAAELNRVWP